jgi:phosphoribosylamine--glycine ligase
VVLGSGDLFTAQACLDMIRLTGVDGVLVSSGGRVVDVVATGADLRTARAAAYRAVERIGLEGAHHRTDIALAAERDELHVG